jgi:23S rRNA (guanosine2251-2'-O)-methyltransferase
MTNNTIIFGIRACIEAINAGKTLEKIYIQKDLSGVLFNQLNHLIKSQNIAKSFVPIEKLNKLSKFNNHQGVVAKISQIEFADLEETLINIGDKIPLLLLLDNITDVRNFGAIIRTAECCGVDAIVIPNQGNAPLNAESIKTSAGAAFKVPICRVNHIKDAVFLLQASEIQIVAATEKTNNTLYTVDFKKPTAIVMGSEEKGVSNTVLKQADVKAKLPLLGTIESLNVSVACCAFLYEVVRQRN